MTKDTDVKTKEVEFILSLKAGDFIHTCPWEESGGLIRYEVVVTKGKKGVRAVGLVGEWDPEDLPHHLPDGTLYETILTKCISNGTVYPLHEFVVGYGLNPHHFVEFHSGEA